MVGERTGHWSTLPAAEDVLIVQELMRSDEVAMYDNDVACNGLLTPERVGGDKFGWYLCNTTGAGNERACKNCPDIDMSSAVSYRSEMGAPGLLGLS